MTGVQTCALPICGELTVRHNNLNLKSDRFLSRNCKEGDTILVKVGDTERLEFVIKPTVAITS